MPPTPAESPLPDEKPTSEGYGPHDGAIRTRVFAPDLFEDGYSDPVYLAKARILSHAMQEIGMGKYQV